MTTERALATYLKDHLAGSVGGVSLARRITAGSEDEVERQEMAALAAEIEADRHSLLAIMERLEVAPSRFKQAGARIGEKLGALKLNATRADRRVLQYEGMIMGLTGKLELWRSLEQNVEAGLGLKRDEIGSLAKRAEDQRKRLEGLHAKAAVALSRA